VKQEGLTLVEILIAIVIVGVAFMALANLQITNMRVTRDSQQASVATQIANEILEHVTRDVYGGSDPSYNIYNYYTCTGGNTSSLCQYGGALPDAKFPQLDATKYPGLNQYSYSVVIESLYDDPGTPPTSSRTMAEFLNEGLIKATISVAGPSSLTFTSYLTCYDVSTTPTLQQGKPCHDPYDPAVGG
jgi:type IV pilus modification protein PilV